VKILMITHRFPYPPDRGDRLLAFRTIEVLARAHEVHVLSFTDETDPPDSVAALEALGVRVRTVPRSRARSLARTALALGRRTPLQVAYFESARMAEAARSEAHGRFDVVAAQMIRMTPYGLLAPARYRVAMLGDCLDLLLTRRVPFEPAWKRPLVELERRRARAFERAMAGRYDESWLVAGEDVEGFPPHLRARLRVVPNGFPTDLLTLPLERPATRRILFVGHLGVPHNVDAARELVREVLPRVRARHAQATVRLVGAGAVPAVRDLAAPPAVEFVGFVPDLAVELREAEVFVAVLRFAAGVQNKILEAVAAGVPVVTSPIAARGLGLPDDGGGYISTGRNAAEIAAAVAAILDDPRAARERAVAARDWLARTFRWENALEAMAAIERRLGDSVSPRPAAGPNLATSD